jgi:hypothetical protein
MLRHATRSMRENGGSEMAFWRAKMHMSRIDWQMR